jgi:hypothetical protein
MSFDLFQLVPAVYRLRDAQIASTMQLLTAAEQTLLKSLQTSAIPLTADQQAQLDELTAKSTRGPLESLLMVIGEQLAAFAEDLDQLYDDQFIETCAPWVIPYIGDLIGYQSIHGITASVDNPRSEVADTISLRRRKGTVLVLEQLARDVTGWGAHAVEFFQVLGDTEYMKHVRPRNFYSPNVRGWEPRLFRNSGFSKMTHKVDVHNMATVGLPRYNIQNIGIFLWSLGAYSITEGTPTASASNAALGPFCYRFSSLGIDMPLFHAAISQGEQITARATEVNVPDWLPRLVLCADMQKGIATSYYGEGASLALYLNSQLLNPYQIQVADLSGADGSWNNLPTATSQYAALVDPELGRIALPPIAAGATAPHLAISYFYGFNGEMGGGEYERQDSFTVTDEAWIFPYPDTDSTPRYHTLQEALTFVVGELGVEGAVALEIGPSAALDTSGSATFAVTTAGALSVDLPKGTTVEFRAQDGGRPTVLVDGELSVTGDVDSTFIINGILFAASTGMTPGGPPSSALVHVPALRPSGSANLLQELNLSHCTLVPGWAVNTSGEPVYPSAPVLIAEPSGLEVVTEYSILGAIRAPEFVTVNLSNSIVDATDRALAAYAALDGESGGGALTMQGCTVVGKVHAQVLTLVSDSIIWATASDGWVSGLIADRLQTGCVRFSFLPVNPVIPRHFECVEQALASPAPIFFSLRYGSPGYLKMLACTDDGIRRGADDGGEMGAFHFVLAPLRESDLTVRLQEYLPVGLDAGIVYQT